MPSIVTKKGATESSKHQKTDRLRIQTKLSRAQEHLVSNRSVLVVIHPIHLGVDKVLAEFVSEAVAGGVDVDVAAVLSLEHTNHFIPRLLFFLCCYPTFSCMRPKSLYKCRGFSERPTFTTNGHTAARLQVKYLLHLVPMVFVASMIVSILQVFYSLKGDRILILTS
jgi:hypothetical protein